MKRKKKTRTVNRSRAATVGTPVDLNIWDALPEMCFIVSNEGKLISVNRHALELIVRRRDDLVGASFSSFLMEPFRRQFEEALRHCIRDGVNHALEVQLTHGSERVIDVMLYLSRYPLNASSSAAQCIILARDISEEKKKELDLLRFSNVAHFTVNPLEITDVDGRIIYVNPAFEKASGYSKEELLGKNPKIFGSGKHPKSFWQKMWATITSGKVWMGEVENRRRSGEPFYTQLLVSPILDSEGKIAGYFGVHRDITEQKHLEQQLVQAQKMESIGTLAAGIAHEVGNPLTSISSLAQVIQRTTQDEFVREKLELIKSQVNRISRIIRDLVDFSRPSNYEVQRTDVNKCLREAVEIVRVGKKAKEIAIHVDLDEKIPSLPLVPDQIQQVFINILINAVDAITEAAATRRIPARLTGVSRSGGLAGETKRGEMFVSTSMDDEHVIIRVQDSGKGIAEQNLPKVFEPFFTTKSVGEGTGLGLWVSYGIVKSFHGDIRVQSEEGKGTTFYISLPLRTDYTS